MTNTVLTKGISNIGSAVFYCWHLCIVNANVTGILLFRTMCFYMVEDTQSTEELQVPLSSNTTVLGLWLLLVTCPSCRPMDNNAVGQALQNLFLNFADRRAHNGGQRHFRTLKPG